MENNELVLIEQIEKEVEIQTVQELASAQQMGMVTSQEDLTRLLQSGMEVVIEEYIQRIENQSKIILNEAGSIRKDSNSN